MQTIVEACARIILSPSMLAVSVRHPVWTFGTDEIFVIPPVVHHLSTVTLKHGDAHNMLGLIHRGNYFKCFMLRRKRRKDMLCLHRTILHNKMYIFLN